MNEANGKVYIGQTKNYAQRLNRHQLDLRKGVHHNKHLQAAWDKYGEGAFRFTEVENNIPDASILDKEAEYILSHNALNFEYGYNQLIEYGGKRILSEEALARRSESIRSRPSTSKQLAQLDRLHSDPKIKEKISQTLSGRKQDPNTREKSRSAGLSRSHLTEEDVKNIRSLAETDEYAQLGGKKKLAARFDLSPQGLYAILKRTRWAHI